MEGIYVSQSEAYGILAKLYIRLQQLEIFEVAKEHDEGYHKPLNLSLIVSDAQIMEGILYGDMSKEVRERMERDTVRELEEKGYI